MGLIKHPVYTHIKWGHLQSGSSTDMPVATKQKLGEAHTGYRELTICKGTSPGTSGLKIQVSEGGAMGRGGDNERGEDGGHWDLVFGVDLLSLAPSFLCFLATMRRAAFIHHLDKRGDKAIMAP